MILETLFESQLQDIYKSGILQGMDGCQWIKHKKGQIRAQYQIIDDSVHQMIELCVKYEHIFHEPQLCFRLWTVDSTSTESLTLCYDLKISVPNWFVVNIDLIDNQPWFMVGVCDTPTVVGDTNLPKERYMSRWIDIYWKNWVVDLQSPKEQ